MVLNQIDKAKIECLVAAILAAPLINGGAPSHAVNQYSRILRALREAGGPEHPEEKTG